MAKTNKITPEWILEEYMIPLSRLKTSFGLQGVSIDNIQTYNATNGNKTTEGIRISLRRWKKDINADESVIPEGVDSARG